MGNLELPRWPDEKTGDGTSALTPGGLLDGLPKPIGGSGLRLLLGPSPSVDGIPETVREGVEWGKPITLPGAPEVCSPSGTAPSPEEYARRGALAEHAFLNPVDPDGNSEMAGPIYLAHDLLQFRRGGPLDAQVRYKGSHQYANYAFGVYNAAAVIPLREALDMANAYGKHASHYPKKVIMDKVYPSIPAENVENITKGS